MDDGSPFILESALYVDDLDAAEAFYGGVLGFPLIGREPGRHLFFRAGAGVLLIFDPRATERPDPGATLAVPAHGARGPGHLCLRADPPGIAAWRERLEAAGVAVEAEVAWPQGGRSVYFRDPAGNSLEVAEARIWGLP